MTSRFDNELEIFLKMRKLKAMHNANFTEIRDRYFLKQVEIELLFYLSVREGATARSAAAELQLHKGHVSLAKECLIKKGLIRSVRDEHDHRYERLMVTEEGEKINSELVRKKEELEEKLFNGFSAEERDLFTGLFTRMMNNVEDDVTFQEAQLKTGLLGKTSFVEMMENRRKQLGFSM